MDALLFAAYAVALVGAVALSLLALRGLPTKDVLTPLPLFGAVAPIAEATAGGEGAAEPGGDRCRSRDG